MGVLLGLTAALLWGVADFLTPQATRRIGSMHTMFYFESIGLCATILLLVLWPQTPTAGVEIWLLMFGVGLMNVAGTVVLYRAFRVGTVALVAPIASGYSVITALLALLAGERPDLLPLLGAALLVSGVVVVARTHPAGTGTGRAGLPEAVAAAAIYGVLYWLLKYVTPALGPLWPVLVVRVMKTTAALVVLRRRRTPPARLSWPTAALMIAAAISGTLGYTAYNTGVATSYTSIVTTIASLSSVVTVVLAWAILRERLTRGQWVGVAVILCGVLLVSL